MATLNVVKSSFAPCSVVRRSDPRRRRPFRRERIFFCGGFRVLSKLKDDENHSSGEEPPESLFMKELKRRGMDPTSLPEESNRSMYGDDEMKNKEEGGYLERNAVSTDYKKSLTNQREQSMALNSEGLEGLIPRAKLLISLGASFFLGFGPLILITVAFFSALYLYFGPAFIHDASRTPVSPIPYVDPYSLLEDERISQMATRRN